MKNFIVRLHEAAEMNGQELTVARSRAIATFMDRSGYTDAQCCDALQQHCRASAFIPSPAELIQHIDGSPADRAVEQWARVLASFSGNRDRSGLDSAAVHAIASMGGWQVVGHTPEKDLHWAQKRFAEAYAAYDERASDAAQLANDPKPTAVGRENQKRLRQALTASGRSSQ